MAGRIPEIVYRKLASQQTGTLGVDLSAGKATRAIADSIAEPIKEQEKKEAKLKDVDAATNAIRQTTDYTNKYSDFSKYDSREDWYADASEGIESSALNARNPREEAEFRRRAANRLDQMAYSARKFYKERTLASAAAGVEERIEGAENDAYDAGRNFKGFPDPKTDDLGIAEGVLSDVLSGGGMFTLPSIVGPMAEDISDIGAAGGADETATNAMSKQGTARATEKFLYGILDSENPERVNEVLDAISESSDYMEELGLSRDRVSELRSNAAKLQKKQAQKKINETKTLRNAKVQEVYDRLLDDPREVTMAEWDALRFRPDPLVTQEQYNAGKKKILAAPERGFPENSAASIDGILKDFHTSFEKVKKGEIPGIENADEMALEQIAHLQAVIMDSQAANEIGPEVAKTWLDELDPKLDLGLAQILDRFNKNAEWLEPKGGSEEDWVKSKIWKTDEEAKNALAQFKTDMLQNIQKAEEVVDRTLTTGELDDVLEASTQEFASRYNPARREYALGQKRFDPISKKELKVVAWDEFGYPVWTDNLQAPLREPKERSELIEQVMSGR